MHHVAHRMANPPTERPQSRKEFQQALQQLEMTHADVQEKFGYGAKTADNGDRLVIVWEAHTEYYSYQVWHIAGDASMPLTFGPLTYPGYFFPFSPLGVKVNALDLLILPQPDPTLESLHASLPGPHLYGSRMFGEDIHARAPAAPTRRTDGQGDSTEQRVPVAGRVR